MRAVVGIEFIPRVKNQYSPKVKFTHEMFVQYADDHGCHSEYIRFSIFGSRLSGAGVWYARKFMQKVKEEDHASGSTDNAVYALLNNYCTMVLAGLPRPTVEAGITKWRDRWAPDNKLPEFLSEAEVAERAAKRKKAQPGYSTNSRLGFPFRRTPASSPQ